MASKIKKKQAQANLLRYCTGCGWKYKTGGDKFCGECGAQRKER